MIDKLYKKIKASIDNSFYIKQFNANVWLIVWSAFFSVACTFVSYPGIWYSDAYTRVSEADGVLNCISKLFNGDREYPYLMSWITITPSYFMAVCKSITGNIAFYTWIQSFTFFLLTFLFIKKLNSSGRKLLYFIFATSPMIWCVSVYYEAGIGCVSGIVALILLLDSSRIEKSRIDKILEILLIILFSFVTFGFRANAFTIIPVFIVYILLSRSDWIKKGIVLIALLLGYALVFLVPIVLKIDTMSSVSAGFTWEMLTVIQRMDSEKREHYMEYLDDIFGGGATVNALEVNREDSVNGFLWGDDINYMKLSGEGVSKAVLKKYITIMYREPGDYIPLKWYFTRKTLGIDRKGIENTSFDYDSYGRMAEYGFNDCTQRQFFVNAYHWINRALGFYTRHPWFVFLIAIVLTVIKYRQKDKNSGLYLFILSLAIFYYGAYVINTQSFELRYFYPSLYLMMILSVSIERDLILDAIKKVRITHNEKHLN